MVRSYKRKTARTNTDPEVIRLAVNDVKEKKRSLRPVAADYGINYRTLGRYYNKFDATQQQTILSKDAAENTSLARALAQNKSFNGAVLIGKQSFSFPFKLCGYRRCVSKVPRLFQKEPNQ